MSRKIFFCLKICRAEGVGLFLFKYCKKNASLISMSSLRQFCEKTITFVNKHSDNVWTLTLLYRGDKLISAVQGYRSVENNKTLVFLMFCNHLCSILSMLHGKSWISASQLKSTLHHKLVSGRPETFSFLAEFNFFVAQIYCFLFSPFSAIKTGDEWDKGMCRP